MDLGFSFDSNLLIIFMRQNSVINTRSTKVSTKKGQMTPILHFKHLKVYSHLTPFGASMFYTCLQGISYIEYNIFLIKIYRIPESIIRSRYHFLLY
ncbi:hypothetical protein BpHYR1_032438 [Brachionus plicatilis]|uniref:Uncharacterized protein n=1 Tax=Brachionus plicatilis TaxID=10195 RepID=A0A3M7PLU9_BRAPC|nr:hypothetical protein BpHYR1_032438 [Brachionus plicatilis]